MEYQKTFSIFETLVADKPRLSLLGNEATSLHVQPCLRKRDPESLCVGVTYSGREVYAYIEMVWWFWMCQL